MARTRGSIWQNNSKKAGYTLSVGSYGYKANGDRHFVLTAVKTGKTRVYESPHAAIADGWFIVKPGK